MPGRDVGRNDPCPCGSGRKFKKCCEGKAPAPSAAPKALDIHGALALHRQGLFAEALAAYAAILKSSPRDFNALNLSGAACFALGDWPRAAEFMERAREVDPAQPLPHSNLSAVY